MQAGDILLFIGNREDIDRTVDFLDRGSMDPQA